MLGIQFYFQFVARHGIWQHLVAIGEEHPKALPTVRDIIFIGSKAEESKHLA